MMLLLLLVVTAILLIAARKGNLLIAWHGVVFVAAGGYDSMLSSVSIVIIAVLIEIQECCMVITVISFMEECIVRNYAARWSRRDILASTSLLAPDCFLKSLGL